MARNSRKDGLWITWEDHRRSRELADAFEVPYYALESRWPRLIRYFVLGFRTLVLVVNERPRVVFCQNPSIALATLLCILKPVLGYTLVVDRHSNFKLETLGSRSPKLILFHWLSRWTIKRADRTIVTNQPLADVVADWGGRPEVLQDRIPTMAPTTPPRRPSVMQGRTGPSVMCVTTYSGDEPIDELIEALRGLEGVTAYLTGRYERTGWAAVKEDLQAHHIVLTGFLSAQDYVDLMAEVDVVVVLTVWDNVLTCGAYEAFAMGKPMVLSDTSALRQYFGEAPIYVSPEASSIQEGIDAALRAKAEREEMISRERRIIVESWNRRFGVIRGALFQDERLASD